jgi:hypothetical protein
MASSVSCGGGEGVWVFEFGILWRKDRGSAVLALVTRYYRSIAVIRFDDRFSI